MSTHTQNTPGPWIVSNGRNGISILGAMESHPMGSARGSVAWCGFNLGADNRPTERQTANARLIAAAPELVEALRDLLENRVAAERYLSILEGTDEKTIQQTDAELDSPEMQRARALLARLEGQA